MSFTLDQFLALRRESPRSPCVSKDDIQKNERRKKAKAKRVKQQKQRMRRRG